MAECMVKEFVCKGNMRPQAAHTHAEISLLDRRLSIQLTSCLCNHSCSDVCSHLHLGWAYGFHFNGNTAHLLWNLLNQLLTQAMWFKTTNACWLVDVSICGHIFCSQIECEAENENVGVGCSCSKTLVFRGVQPSLQYACMYISTREWSNLDIKEGVGALLQIHPWKGAHFCKQ